MVASLCFSITIAQLTLSVAAAHAHMQSASHSGCPSSPTGINDHLVQSKVQITHHRASQPKSVIYMITIQNLDCMNTVIACSDTATSCCCTGCCILHQQSCCSCTASSEAQMPNSCCTCCHGQCTQPTFHHFKCCVGCRCSIHGGSLSGGPPPTHRPR